ncbi:pentapeptide repeat-containing protein [Myxococcus stipitatus DSM 14675]|uniref:Pentapeptide repeat-containing protein n=1 Tax=Myxococcus stipitatus (strain DSM 14675 / JCM 12634 / Mx s8) TaxID=1278073 RepID=L7U5J0_MYXSD|nr:pentapeptide repeat-containing protein [Myxococcus stipitatus]AGC43378.1 pentapeptide repeat-containing protein [Myxococcus stipitatus DSM 14675]
MVIRCETGDDLQVDGDSLVGARLAGCNLHRALLGGQDLRRANLSGANLRSAWLEGANLEEASLSRSGLPACNAARVRFVRADLSEAFMRSADFTGADFTGANLRNAEMGRSNFAGACFDDADVRGLNLAEAHLQGARANSATKWPEGFEPAPHGVHVRPPEETMIVSTRILPLSHLTRTRLWIGTRPNAPYLAEGVERRTVAAGQEQPRLTSVGIEILRPLGGFAEYGLLELSWTRDETRSELHLEVPWTESRGPLWRIPPLGGMDSAHIGLPKEVAAAVLEGLDSGARARLSGGVLTVSAAVRSPVGTNPHVMRQLGRACVELMLAGDQVDASLGASLKERFR